MNNLTIGQKLIAIHIGIGGRLGYEFHDFTGPHNPNIHASMPWLCELECVNVEHELFHMTRVYHPSTPDICVAPTGAGLAILRAIAPRGEQPYMQYFHADAVVEGLSIAQYWLLADHYIHHLSEIVDNSVMEQHPYLHSIESHFRRIREMVGLFKNGEKPPEALYHPPSFSIPASRYESFCIHYSESNDRRRWGQAFYDYMQAHKCQQDAWWWDRLYNAQDGFAKSMVRALLDFQH